jgi:hypothetical protein
MSRASLRPDTRGMRLVLRVLGIGFLGLLTLLVAGYVVHGVVATVSVHRAEAAARSDVAEGLPHAVDLASQDRSAVRAALEHLGAPTHSFSELSCDLGSNDAGWIVEEYTQECVVRSVDLYAVTHGPRRCESISVDASVAPGTFVVAQRGSTSSLSLTKPYYRMCPDGLTRPSPFGSSRLLSGSRPTDLTASPAWVVAETSTPVSDSVLGCSPWAVIFCGEPVDRPVLPAEG